MVQCVMLIYANAVSETLIALSRFFSFNHLLFRQRKNKIYNTWSTLFACFIYFLYAFCAV